MCVRIRAGSTMQRSNKTSNMAKQAETPCHRVIEILEREAHHLGLEVPANLTPDTRVDGPTLASFVFNRLRLSSYRVRDSMTIQQIADQIPAS